MQNECSFVYSEISWQSVILFFYSFTDYMIPTVRSKITSLLSNFSNFTMCLNPKIYLMKNHKFISNTLKFSIMDLFFAVVKIPIIKSKYFFTWARKGKQIFAIPKTHYTDKEWDWLYIDKIVKKISFISLTYFFF